MSSVTVPLEAAQGHSYQYQAGFEKGYTERMKEKRGKDVIAGAIIGTAGVLVVYLVISTAQ